MPTRHATPTPAAASFADASGLVTRIVAGARGVAVALGHRRDVKLLLELDERALRDIGLSRNDVLGALAEPLTSDPSRVLVGSVRRGGRPRVI